MVTKTSTVKNMTKKQIQTFFERLRDQRPNPTTELNFSTPFELLVAVTLSAQATDVSVNKATDKLFPIANTPETILELGVEGLKQYIRTIGLYNSKAENVIKTCQILIERHKNCKCGVEYCIRTSHHGGGYAYFSIRQSDRFSSRKKCPRS